MSHLQLATPDTIPTAPARFFSLAGDLYVDNRPITLGDAFRLCCRWEGEALTLGRNGHRDQAHVYRREAYALEAAVRDCVAQRMAAGWANVLDADREARA